MCVLFHYANAYPPSLNTHTHTLTQHSLCILDELGRGTATFDGTAIAHAVVNHLASHTRCRAIFATHYHSLVHDWEGDPRVAMGHMQCVVGGQDDAEDQDQDQGQGQGMDGSKHATSSSQAAATEEVTFLYQLSPGASPRSYGINVARLAQLPQEVIALAVRQSAEFERSLALSAQGMGVAMDVDNHGTAQATATATATTTTTTTLAASASRSALVPLFNTLVSLAESSLPVGELAECARELWRRMRSSGVLGVSDE